MELRPAAGYLAALDQREPNLGLRFVVTDTATGPLPVRGADVVVVCVKDELALRPSYTEQVGVVFKCYGTDRPFLRAAAGGPVLARAMVVASEGAVQARRLRRSLPRTLPRTLPRSLSRSLSRTDPDVPPGVIDIPLGCLVDPPAEVKPVEARSIDLAFLGSIEVGRALTSVTSLKEAGRRRLVQQLKAMSRSGTRSIHLSTTGSYFESQGRHRSYADTLADTRIVPCPRGNSLETYRLFEALAFGCIPVLADPLPDRYYYRGAPFVRIDRWSRLPATVDRLLGDRAGLEARQREGLEWWHRQCSPPAVADRMLSVLRTVYGR